MAGDDVKIGGGVKQAVGQSNLANQDPDIVQPHASGVDISETGKHGAIFGDYASGYQDVNQDLSNTANLSGTGGSAGSGEVESNLSGNIGNIQT